MADRIMGSLQAGHGYRDAMHEPVFFVLQTRDEVLQASRRGTDLRLAHPPVFEKWWDNLLALEALRGLEHEPVIDLGCRTGIVLTWLHQQGYRVLLGCDLREPVPPLLGTLRRRRVRDALAMSAMYLRNRKSMHRVSIESTGLPAGSVAAATCMSVIEHGVDLPRFFAEAQRILRPGGRLIISTDYWPEPIDLGNSRLWNDSADVVFDAFGLERLVELAREAGSSAPGAEGSVGDPVVSYRGRRYTFVFMTFLKPGR